jgi:hypothetical protein
LKLRRGPADVPIPIRIFSPKQQNDNWTCRFEIDWPDEMVALDAGGVDSVQALELALRMIGAFVYTSDHHEAGNRMGEAPGQGYGFPVPNSIRDLLIGEDQKSQ